MNLKTTVTLKGLTLACRLFNLSATGALIAASFHPPIGARVELDGRVVQVRRSGVSFL